MQEVQPGASQKYYQGQEASLSCSQLSFCLLPEDHRLST